MKNAWSSDATSGTRLEQPDPIDRQHDYALAVVGYAERRRADKEMRRTAVERRAARKAFVRDLVLNRLRAVEPGILDITDLFEAGEHCQPRVNKLEIRQALDTLTDRVNVVGQFVAMRPEKL